MFYRFARGHYFKDGLGAGHYPLHKPRRASVLIGFKSIPHKACLLGVRTKVEIEDIGIKEKQVMLYQYRRIFVYIFAH